MSEQKPSKKQPKRITVSDELYAYLGQLAKTRLYGKGVSGTACFILKREITDLITSGKFDMLLARTNALNLSADEDESEDESGD